MTIRTTANLAAGLAVLALGLSTPAHADDAAAAEAAFQKFAKSWVADLDQELALQKRIVYRENA